MTFEEVKKYLLECVKASRSPYEYTAFDKSKFDHYSPNFVIPCGKLIASEYPRYRGGIFLMKDLTFSLWVFSVEEECDYMVDQLPEDWMNPELVNQWTPCSWYLTRAPWVITDYLKENGIT